MARIEQAKKVMDEVYGKCLDPRTWSPKKYKDTKSRYLWTDAFGVCNYISLFCETQDPIYIQQADALIKDVHDTLGRDRCLKKRLGQSTDERPLLGGLRIGKEDPEGEPDGDGQYFHYLTKWMYALNRMSIVKKDPIYNNWAIDLAKVAHDNFIRGINSDYPKMYWKMRIDLSCPHVDSEGNLDPFDGYVTYRTVQEAASDPNVLSEEIATFKKMVIFKYPRYRSSDPLDLGEALWITHFYPNEEWSKFISNVSLKSLELLFAQGQFLMPENRRLAFREFGTTLGVQAHPLTRGSGSLWNERVEDIHEFWGPKVFKRDHDITPIMYSTSLIPGSFCTDYPPLLPKRKFSATLH